MSGSIHSAVRGTVLTGHGNSSRGHVIEHATAPWPGAGVARGRGLLARQLIQDVVGIALSFWRLLLLVDQRHDPRENGGSKRGSACRPEVEAAATPESRIRLAVNVKIPHEPITRKERHVRQVAFAIVQRSHLPRRLGVTAAACAQLLAVHCAVANAAASANCPYESPVNKLRIIAPGLGVATESCLTQDGIGAGIIPGNLGNVSFRRLKRGRSIRRIPVGLWIKRIVEVSSANSYVVRR